jgi:hypothetical protein
MNIGICWEVSIPQRNKEWELIRVLKSRKTKAPESIK